ncbi:MAG: PAS domain-containing protein [Ramlibacter sp.]|nr:PAS domain-containing protein [Ramlibacter sp.]
MRAVIDNEPECVKVLSPDGTVLDMNRAGLAMLKAHSNNAVIGHCSFDFVHPDDRDSYRLMHERALAGEPSQLQARAIDLDGNTLWIESHAVALRSDDGDVASVLCLTRDITQERASLDKLQQQKALLSIASRLGRIGASAIDVPSMDVTWSDELAALHEMPAGFSPTFDTVLDFYPPEHRRRVVETFQACSLHGKPFDLELEILTCSQRRISVRCIGEAVRDADGTIVRVQGAFQDITAQIEAQQEILRLNAELEQRVRQRTAQLEMANSELQAFSYSVAHDLRAPLMAIGGFSQAPEDMLAKDGSERVAHYVRRMRAGVLRMSEMIDALLSLANLSRTELRWERVDLSALAERARESCSHEAGAAAQVRVRPGMLAHGDPRLLQLVMDNLISNAYKFSSTVASPRIEVDCLEGPAGETIYEVRDNGVGLDMAYSANLFGAFQRLHMPTEFPGTGIGLANVRRIISRHSGRIWAHARPGEGAAFFFTLGKEPA